MHTSNHWLDRFSFCSSQRARSLRRLFDLLRLLGCGLLVTSLLSAHGAAADTDMLERAQRSNVDLLWHDDDLLVLEGGMSIDADGAPRAYSPTPGEGLDALEHAGSPEHWDGIATTADGDPMVQGPGDPAPGYYVSTTALEDHSYPPHSQKRYVDATIVPYIALPRTEDGPRLGDYALVMNTHTRKVSPAIFADVSDVPGEGSIALAERLDINPDARRGGTDQGIVYIVFKNSGTRTPPSHGVIAEKVQELWSDASVQEVWDELCSRHPDWSCGDSWAP